MVIYRIFKKNIVKYNPFSESIWSNYLTVEAYSHRVNTFSTTIMYDQTSYKSKSEAKSNHVDVPKVLQVIILHNYQKENILNVYFASVFTQDYPNIDFPTISDTQYPIINDVNITTTGVTNILRKLNIHKATGLTKYRLNS